MRLRPPDTLLCHFGMSEVRSLGSQCDVPSNPLRGPEFLRVDIQCGVGLFHLSSKQIEALDFLEEVANEPVQSVRFRQEPGDILLLNNWITLHRRSAFEDHEDPEERRRLFRIWLSMPNSRPIDPNFEANFGATGAGELRGGFRTSD